MKQTIHMWTEHIDSPQRRMSSRDTDCSDELRVATVCDRMRVCVPNIHRKFIRCCRVMDVGIWDACSILFSELHTQTDETKNMKINENCVCVFCEWLSVLNWILKITFHACHLKNERFRFIRSQLELNGEIIPDNSAEQEQDTECNRNPNRKHIFAHTPSSSSSTNSVCITRRTDIRTPTRADNKREAAAIRSIE